MKKILLFKIGAIGDTLMTTPFVRQLRERYPDATIDYLIGSASKDVLIGNKNLNKIIPFDESIIFKRRIKEYFALIRKVKKEHYDKVFVLDKHWAMNFSAKMFGIKERIGFDRLGKEGKFLTKKTYYGNDKHEIHYYLDLLKADGIRPDYKDTRMDLTLSKNDIKKAESIWKKNSLEKGVVCIIPGGGNNPGESSGIRNWPIDNYTELIKRLVSKGHQVVLIGGKSDKELSKNILENKNIRKSILDLIGKLSLKESAAVISKCDVVVCNDSGPMHLAACVNNNVISLFGPTNPKRKAPLLKESHSIWKGKKHYDKNYELFGKTPDRRAIESMRKITVDDVLKYIK